jgi:hypothetical protein
MFLNPTFRAMFPEFTDLGAYPDLAITAYANLAKARLDERRWGEMLDYGISLYVAHFMALARKEAIARSSGKGNVAPGAMGGLVTSKSVDKVSVSYDVSTVLMKDAGQWNLTRYGAELYQLMGQMGAGGIQVNSPSFPESEGVFGEFFGGL